MRAVHPLPLVVVRHAAFLAPVDLHVGGSRSMVTGPWASAAARSAGSSASIRPVTAATPPSTACHCTGVLRRAGPAAVARGTRRGAG
jgi:hypothetical protein